MTKSTDKPAGRRHLQPTTKIRPACIWLALTLLGGQAHAAVTTSTSLSTSATSAYVGSNVVLTAAVLRNPAGTLTGPVTFQDGATELQPAVNLSGGKALLTTAGFTSPGTHSYTATYNKYCNNIFCAVKSTSAPVVVTVKYATTTTLSSNALTAPAGQIVTLTAFVKPTVGNTVPSGNAVFLDKGVSIGSTPIDANGKATLPTACLTTGTHNLTVRYDGAANYGTSASDTVNVTITQRTGPAIGKLKWGTNAHLPTDQWSNIADTIVPRGMSLIRAGMWVHDPVNVAKIRTLAINMASRNIKTQTILFDPYSHPYDKSKVCDADPALVEADSFNLTTQALKNVDDVIQDFELQNEVSWWPNIKKPDTTGQNAGDFDTPCGHLQAANLRGMSRAIIQERTRTGLPLRIILGTVDRFVGFYDFMLQQGVSFDVIGFHRYQRENQGPLAQATDGWFGPGGALGQFARFNRPVTVNEFNCGEIYDTDFENLADQPKTEACFRSLSKHLKEIVDQTLVNVESVLLYELTDEPNLVTEHEYERRFGLMYDLSRPKVSLFIASAFAGGKLSSSETTELTRRQLLSAEQITAWGSCGARP